MTENITTSFKIPSWLNQELLEAMIVQEYGLRGRSQWVAQAINAFLKIEGFWEFVNIVEEIEENDCAISIRIPKPMETELQEAIKKIRQYYPLIEGVKSKIIRASILQRLIRDGVVLIK